MAHILPSELTCTEGWFYCFGKWMYEVTRGTFWIFALLGFCVALFLATLRLGNRRAFGFASFVGMLGAVFFAILKYMDWGVASLFILTGLVGIAVLIMTED